MNYPVRAEPFGCDQDSIILGNYEYARLVDAQNIPLVFGYGSKEVIELIAKAVNAYEHIRKTR